MKIKIAFLLLPFLLFFSCLNNQKSEIIPIVEVKYEEGKAMLYRHGKPYQIVGAGGFEHMEKISQYGGNSIRTWSTDNAKRILDEAELNGLTVTLGLEVGKQWWGDDFNYWDFKKVNQKIEELRKTVREYKNHPALLMWGIGNEVYLFGGNRWIVYYTINKIAKMIHEEDPHHPVMTAIPVGHKYDRFTFSFLLMPDLDILGYNAFNSLTRVYDQIYGFTGWGKAYTLTEWGPIGHWEAVTTEWGAPRELSSTEKAKRIQDYYHLMEKDSSLYLGGYAFYWGHKYEITHTWFSLFSEEGFETESVNFLKSKWSEIPQDNWAPRVEKMEIVSYENKENIYLESDALYEAQIFANDPENDSLTYRWELRHEEADFYESGKFKYNMRHLLFPENCSSIQFRTPKEEGGYRLFAFVYDGQNNVASHNIPFYVIIK